MSKLFRGFILVYCFFYLVSSLNFRNIMSHRNIMGLRALTYTFLLAWISFFGSSYSAHAAMITDNLIANHKIDENLLVPYRAVYDIKMTTSKRGSEVLGITGQVAINFQHSCIGWITDQQYRMIYEYSANTPLVTTSQISIFEKLDGSSMNFSTLRIRNGETFDAVRGRAKLHDSSHGKSLSSAYFDLPEQTTISLPVDVLLPTAHTQYLIGQAKAGKKIIYAKIFDGSDPKGPFEANAVVTSRHVPSPLKPDKTNRSSNSKIDLELIGVPSWSINMAVYPPQTVDELADYELSMELFENGVVRDVKVDYHDFSIKQHLISLQKLPRDKCED